MAERPAIDRLFRIYVAPTALVKVVVAALSVVNVSECGEIFALSTIELKVTFPALPVAVVVNVVSAPKETAFPKVMVPTVLMVPPDSVTLALPLAALVLMLVNGVPLPTAPDKVTAPVLLVVIVRMWPPSMRPLKVSAPVF